MTLAALAPTKRNGPNPKDSMKSTWRRDKSQWGLEHYFLHFVNGFATELDKDVPVHPKTDKVPRLSDLSCHIYILLHAAWPMALQYAYTWYTGYGMNPIAAFFLYTLAFRLNVIHEVHIIRRLGHIVGFLDGDKHERDEVPDVGVGKTLASVLLTTGVRPLFTVFLAYRRSDPVTLSPWLPVELALYSVVLDFWFYIYHRSCHEIDGLWKFHRTHHLTKHPTALLSSYADAEQETLEIALIPLATYGVLKLMGFPMTFHDWWICHEYLIFTEAFGHSGLRMRGTPPGTAGFFLRWFDAELVGEDHDMHHRNGWRKSHNYGKQTLLWDRIFGTAGERVECADSNLEGEVWFPLI